MPRTTLVPTLNRSELNMFTAIIPNLDAMLVHDLGFEGLVEYAIRAAFIEAMTGPEVDRLRRVAKFIEGRFESPDDRFASADYAALYGCTVSGVKPSQK